MTQDTTPRHLGRLISDALDPHHRAAMLSAIDAVLAERQDNPHVALIGWKAATLLDAFHDRVGYVTIIEPDDTLHDALTHSLATHGYGTHVRLIHKDPLQTRFDERADIVIMTLGETWFIGGQEVELINHVHEHLLAPQGVTIPRRVVHLFELASSAHTVGGMSLRVPRYTRPGEPVAVLSEAKHFITQGFAQDHPLPSTIDDTIYVKPLLGGTITNLRLRTLYELAPNVIQTTSASGVQSILVPLREDIDVDRDQPISVLIRYKTGEGLQGLRLSAKVLPHESERDLDPAQKQAATNFEQRVGAMVDDIDRRGRGADLDRVVSYTIQPHGDVGRLTALFWTIDEEFHKPLSDVIDSFKREASAHGPIPDDETIYRILLAVYQARRDQAGSKS